MYRDTDDIEELQSLLNDIHIDKDVNTTRKILKQVLHIDSCGIDTSAVFPSVMKLLPSNDLIIKKLASWYITRHANHECIILVFSTLTKECQDPNPMTRALALKTFSSIVQPEIIGFLNEVITASLKDSSAYVRRAAVSACVKIHDINPTYVLESGWIDMLYAMIRDSDPIVVASCISVLEILLEREGGMVVNRQIAHYLLNKLSKFTDWHLLVVLKVLKKYKPRSDEESLDIMNIADDHLRSSNISVVLETLQLFLSLIRQMPHLESELYARAVKQIHHFLGNECHEMVFTLLEVIEKLMDKQVDFSPYYKSFFCKYNEPVYLKEQKISMLPRVISAGNSREILDELDMYSKDVVPTVAKSAVQAIRKIASRLPECEEQCLETLLCRLEAHPTDVTDELVIVLQALDLRKSKDLDGALGRIAATRDYVESDDAHAAIVMIIGDYGAYLPEAPYILEDYIDQLDERHCETIAVTLLTAITKLFLVRPAECQDMLGRLMEHCMQYDSVVVRDRVLFIYQLLKTDRVQAKLIMSSV